MSIIKDEYILGQSAKKSLTDIAEAVRIDLSLSPNPYINSGDITGIVKDTLGNRISDTAVIVLDQSFEIITNAITDNDGMYYLSHIKPGFYRAYAKARGFSTAESSPFNVISNQKAEINFSLLSDFSENYAIITGEVTNSNGLPVNSATVELYRIGEKYTELLYISFTNSTGRFVLRDVNLGKHFLRINAPGYFGEYYPAEINKSKAIVNIKASLRENIKSSQGIIMGIITDNDGLPLANSDVVLYRTGGNNNLAPVDYTRTNHEGIYLFVNVSKGEYLVNSTRSVFLE